MRSVFPMRGNPWPHDMSISIADDADEVTGLLWVREAWGLHPAGDLPPLLVDQPAEVRETPDATRWEDAWPGRWDAAVRRAATTIAPDDLRELAATPAGEPVRAELLEQLRGPGGDDSFDDAAFDDRYPAWSAGLLEARWAVNRRPPDEQPERRSLDALVPAWRAGLSRIVTIPCRGEYTRVISGSALLVTDATRADPERYSAALAWFAGQRPAG